MPPRYINVPQRTFHLVFRYVSVIFITEIGLFMGAMPFVGVVDGVFQVGGQGLTVPGDCCVYLIDAGEGRSVLVDAGLGTHPEGLITNIEETGHPIEKVIALVLTHCHIDHIGGAPAIVDTSGCEVIAHGEDADAIRDGISERTASDAYGVPSPEVAVNREITSDGGILDYGSAHLIVIHTPGHTPGNISLRLSVNGNDLIFANDVHGPFRDAWGSDVDAWRRSMTRLIAMAPDILLEGHMGIIKPKGQAISFLREMLDQDMRSF
jgi:glyoxylase-like metal-dependent hydrolase (beta-lactamase superfamily II)